MALYVPISQELINHVKRLDGFDVNLLAINHTGITTSTVESITILIDKLRDCNIPLFTLIRVKFMMESFHSRP